MNHPSGRIGKRLMLRVSDVMLTGSAVPRVPPQVRLAVAWVAMHASSLQLTCSHLERAVLSPAAVQATAACVRLTARQVEGMCVH